MNVAIFVEHNDCFVNNTDTLLLGPIQLWFNGKKGRL